MKMMLHTALREDALRAAPDGFELRLGLPWIRSMPLSTVLDLKVEIGGVPVASEDLKVRLGARQVPSGGLQAESGWWYVQDRLVLTGRVELPGGAQEVTVDFQLMVPYLQARPGSPLVLPFHVEARLDPGQAPVPGVSRDVA